MMPREAMAGLDIRTVVLVGRRDFGRCPLAARLPTALWPIAGRPVLERLLQHVANEGIRRVTVCCGKDASDSIEAIRTDSRLSMDLVTEELSSGTAGCLRDAVVADPGDLIMVLSGSMVCPPSIGGLIEAHTAGGADLTIAFNPGSPEGLLRGPSAEVYLCRPEVLKHIPGGGYSDIKEGLIPSILRAGGTVRPVVLPQNVGNFHDRAGYLDAMALYLSNGMDAATDYELCERSDKRLTLATPNECVHPTSRIYGPVAIAEHARISEGAVVVGPAVIGCRAAIGEGSVVVGTVLWDDSKVGGHCEIRDSLVDRHAVVPDGTVATGQTISGGSPKLLAYGFGGVLILLAFVWSYWRTLSELWHVWQRSDEYSSGLLVPLLTMYVLWSRRRDLASLAVKPAVLWGVAAFLLAQAVRGSGLYFMYGSAEMLSIVLSVTALVLLLFGWQHLRRLAPILLFLCLMLPWPNRIQTAVSLPLQRWATDSAVFCLELIGHEVVQDGNVIKMGDTRVAVAEACNGLRMITAFLVISGLVVLLAKRAWWEKLIVLVSSLPIALLCNTLRLTVTAVAFTMLKGEYWEKMFHDFGGYAMMPLALAMVVGELWLLRRLTTPQTETQPAVIARRIPRRAADS